MDPIQIHKSIQSADIALYGITKTGWSPYTMAIWLANPPCTHSSILSVEDGEVFQYEALWKFSKTRFNPTDPRLFAIVRVDYEEICQAGRAPEARQLVIGRAKRLHEQETRYDVIQVVSVTFRLLLRYPQKVISGRDPMLDHKVKVICSGACAQVHRNEEEMKKLTLPKYTYTNPFFGDKTSSAWTTPTDIWKAAQKGDLVKKVIVC